MDRRMRLSSPARLAAAALMLTGPLVLGGCFDAPKLEDRWSRIDLVGANVSAFQDMPLGAPESISVQADITFRSILTGYVIADLRVSPTMAPTSVHVTPTAPRQPMAQDIDSLLQHSYTVGRATRAVTGWDHLIQRVDLGFHGMVPAVLDSSGTTGGGLFLLLYLGAGDKVERIGLPDTLIVTPFHSADYKILPIGMTFHTVAGAP